MEKVAEGRRDRDLVTFLREPAGKSTCMGTLPNLVAFAEIVLKRFHDLAPVPQRPNSDYDTFYVFMIDWGKVPTLKFEVRSENLAPISENCPQASRP